MNWSVNNTINNTKDMSHPHDNEHVCECVSKYYEGESNEHLNSETKNSKHS